MKKDEIAEQIIGLAVPEFTEKVKEALEEPVLQKRKFIVFKNCIKEAAECYPNAFICDLTVLDVLTDQMLDLAQTPESMERNLAAFMDRCFSTDDTARKHTILRWICESYLNRMKSDIQNYHLLKKLQSMENKQGKEYREIFRMLEQNNRMLEALCEEGEDAGQERCARSVKEFRDKFYDPLFWDEKVRLCDVYIVPELIGAVPSVIDRVNAFINSKDYGYLIIQGGPGAGKTSLLSMLANRYTDSRYYFLTLSSLDLEEGDHFQAALNRMKEEDPAWENYLQAGNVLFLDGYDEIFGLVPPKKFKESVRRLNSKRIKVIVTTRLDYLWENNKESICTLKSYNFSQRENWVSRYCDAAGRAEEEKNEILRVLRDKQMDGQLMGILSIPIFLYIVVNMKVDIRNLDSETELFEQVFWHLTQGKIQQDGYKYAYEVAERLGYFLQAHSKRRFSPENYQAFLLLASEISEVNLNIEQLRAVLGNSFIHLVSEGTEELEFYHKSIQDYFSAKYIFEKLKQLVIRYTNGEEDMILGAEYAAVLDNHLFKEELPHIQYFVKNDGNPGKEDWGESLRNLFYMAIREGIYAEMCSWIENSWRKRDHLLGMRHVAVRCRYLFENHLMLMTDVLEAPAIEKKWLNDADMAAAFGMAFEDVAHVGGVNTAFFWKIIYGLEVGRVDLIMLSRRRPAEWLFHEYPHVEKIVVRDLSDLPNKRIRIGFKGEKSELRRSRVGNIELHEVTLRECTGKEISLVNSRIEYTRILDSHILGSTLNCNLVHCGVSNTKFRNCIFGAFSEKKGMRLEGCRFVDCVFSNVQFENVNVVKEVEFENCRFSGCSFAQEMEKVRFDETCMMDEESKKSFARVNCECDFI